MPRRPCVKTGRCRAAAAPLRARLFLVAGNVERINHELQTEQQDMMAQVGNGREQQHGAEHQLENSGGERSDPLVAGSVRLQGLVDLPAGPT